jgi:hypothetical protein
VRCAGPAGGSEDDGDAGCGPAGSVEYLPPPQPQSAPPGGGIVEVPVQVDVALGGGVVEEPPVELDDHTETVVLDVPPLDPAGWAVRVLATWPGKAVRALHAGEVGMLQHGARTGGKCPQAPNRATRGVADGAAAAEPQAVEAPS